MSCLLFRFSEELVPATLGLALHHRRRSRDASSRARPLLHRRPHRLLDHHQGLVALPHHGQQRQPQGRRRESLQLLEPDVVVVHLPVLRTERSGQSPETLRVADSATAATLEAGLLLFPATLAEVGAVTFGVDIGRRGCGVTVVVAGVGGCHQRRHRTVKRRPQFKIVML